MTSIPDPNTTHEAITSPSVIDPSDDETVTIELSGARNVDGETINVYPFGPEAGHPVLGPDYPAWWPRRPPAIARLQPTFTIAQRVWVEGPFELGQVRIRRTKVKD